MIMVRKKTGTGIEGCRLGSGTELERRLIGAGLIASDENGYEVWSQEAMGREGERARPGDYVLVDGAGQPYPVGSGTFECLYRIREDGRYEAITQLRLAWMWPDPDDGPVRELVAQGRLEMDEDHPESFFRARLWGTDLTAARDAVLVFYDEARTDFNFVERGEFERTYEIVPKE